MHISSIVRERAIITNNPAVAAEYQLESCYIKGNVMDVFTAVRNAVHKGARILSHPLSGSVKPNESPYKSIVITVATSKLDIKSLNMIEDAISMLRRFHDTKYEYNESVLKDFRIIDLDLIKQNFEPVQSDFGALDMLRQILRRI